MTPTLAIDFGTSNTAAALCVNAQPWRVPIEDGAETLPTAVFFPEGGAPMRIGEAAGRALIAGDEGRYMRAMKSVLGDPLFHEPRLIEGRRRSLAEVVTAFLERLKSRAEEVTHLSFDAVLSGRPVHFHSRDPERDRQAEADLTQCYHDAGFGTVRFMLEPEAAARAAVGALAPGQTGLIVDIGGGTSDFSVFRGGAAGRVQILASHGIRLGGTDFDRALSLDHAMPLLGRGGELRREMGPGTLPVPNAIYTDLASWSRIPFAYSPETRRQVADMVKHACDPVALSRLKALVDEESGHDLAFAVERGKIAANDGGTGTIAMGMVERGLSVPLSAQAMSATMAGYATTLREAVDTTLDKAGIAPRDVDVAVFVGGSSLMSMVRGVIAERCPGATARDGAAFTGVVDGLALATEG